MTAVRQGAEGSGYTSFKQQDFTVLLLLLLNNTSVHATGIEVLLPQALGTDVTIVVACYNIWRDNDVIWNKMLSWSVLSWCSDWWKLLQVLQQRTALNSWTTVIVPSADVGIADFLRTFDKDMRYSYLVTWVILVASPLDLNALGSRVSQYLLCNLIVIETNGNAAVKASASLERFRNCTLREIQNSARQYSDTSTHQFTELRKTFSGKRLRIGCPSKQYRSRGKAHSCLHFVRVIDAMRTLNASIELARIEHRDIAPSLLQKDTDIYMGNVALSLWRFQELDFPVIAHYSYLTFYVRANATSPLLFGTVMANSRTALLLLFGCLFLCFVVLLVMDLLDDRRNDYEMATRTLFLLIAAFYGNSTRVPAASRWKLSLNVLLLSWLLGTFTLTIYIDGELTSWLSVKVPADVVDTLDELSEGIEKRLVFPCVVNGSVFHFLSVHSGEHTLLQRLHAVYNRLGDQMVYGNMRDCLKCATKENAVCLASTIDNCYVRSVGEGIKSAEDFGQLLASTPVRKDFPLKISYRKLVRRLYETGWSSSPRSGRCDGNARFQPVGDETLTLGSLYVLYIASVGTSVLVLMLEMLFHYSVASSVALIGTGSALNCVQSTVVEDEAV